ncbi:hypothetical protein, partial [Xylanibacter rarus]|uniref:hypothetical protein n=1 Tax=Xylanibacter rarus TaxID=1676614 RepID=UPI003FD8B823
DFMANEKKKVHRALRHTLFRETNQVFFGLHHSKKRMTLRIVFASVTLLKSVKYGEVYKSKN